MSQIRDVLSAMLRMHERETGHSAAGKFCANCFMARTVLAEGGEDATRGTPDLLARVGRLESQVAAYDSACLCPGKHAEALSLLREVEWRGENDGGPACPACFAYARHSAVDGKPLGEHRPGCRLAKALGGT